MLSWKTVFRIFYILVIRKKQPTDKLFQREGYDSLLPASTTSLLTDPDDT